MTKKLTNTPRPKYLPTNDVIFKCLLGNPGNERITKSFLEHITGEEIEEISTNFKLELLYLLYGSIFCCSFRSM